MFLMPVASIAITAALPGARVDGQLGPSPAATPAGQLVHVLDDGLLFFPAGCHDDTVRRCGASFGGLLDGRSLSDSVGGAGRWGGIVRVLLLHGFYRRNQAVLHHGQQEHEGEEQDRKDEADEHRIHLRPLVWRVSCGRASERRGTNRGAGGSTP